MRQFIKLTTQLFIKFFPLACRGYKNTHSCYKNKLRMWKWFKPNFNEIRINSENNWFNSGIYLLLNSDSKLYAYFNLHYVSMLNYKLVDWSRQYTWSKHRLRPDIQSINKLDLSSSTFSQVHLGLNSFYFLVKMFWQFAPVDDRFTQEWFL